MKIIDEDVIRNKPVSDAYRKGWERCFGGTEPVEAVATDPDAFVERDADGRTPAYIEHRKHCGNCQGCDFTNEPYARCAEGRRLLGQK